MNMNNFGHVSIVFKHEMTCAHVNRVKCFNFSNIRIRIRTDFCIKISIRRMRILINSVTSLTCIHPHVNLSRLPVVLRNNMPVSVTVICVQF